jgi:hypothetical protein
MQHLDDGYLQSWLDRDRSGITGEEAAEVEAHIAGCEACAARLADLEGTNERARSLLATAGPSRDAAPDFEDVVWRARRKAPSRGGGRSWMAAGWAASLVLAVGLGWLTHDLMRPGGAASDRAPAAEVEGSVAAADLPAVEAEVEVAREGEQAPATAPPPDTAVPEPEVVIAPTTFADAPAPAEDRAPLLVQGRVSGPDGRPLASAQVTIPGAPIGTLTGDDGTFTLSLPAEVLAADQDRPVALTAQLLGYRSLTREIELGTATSMSVDFRLEEAALALDEALVTGAVQAPTAETLRAREAGEPPALAREVWSPVPRDLAGAEAGFELLTVPGLPVLEIETGEVAGVHMVRVRQALDSGATLTLIQWRPGVEEVEPTLPQGQPVAMVERGEVRVTGAAPISLDSLRVLLQGVR